MIEILGKWASKDWVVVFESVRDWYSCLSTIVVQSNFVWCDILLLFSDFDFGGRFDLLAGKRYVWVDESL